MAATVVAEVSARFAAKEFAWFAAKELAPTTVHRPASFAAGGLA